MDLETLVLLVQKGIKMDSFSLILPLVFFMLFLESPILRISIQQMCIAISSSEYPSLCPFAIRQLTPCRVKSILYRTFKVHYNLFHTIFFNNLGMNNFCFVSRCHIRIRHNMIPCIAFSYRNCFSLSALPVL